MMRQKTWVGRLGDERGTVPVLFLAFVLPILFFLLSLSMDLAAFRHETESAQRIADDAGLFAYRFLPYREQAISAAKNYLRRFGADGAGSTVSIVADGIQVEIAREAQPVFGAFFGNESAKLPVRAVSRVRGPSFDAFVALDASAYMAPALDAADGWGNPVDWPASRQIAARLERLSLSLSSRAATQRCFNEGFSGLKLSAIEALDYLSGFALNSVGVGIFSGGPIPLEVIRPVRGFSTLPAGFGESPEADFIAGSHPWIDSIDCAAASDAFDAPEQFRIPPFPPSLPPRGTFRNRPSAMVVGGERQVSRDYLPYLQAREVLWSQISRPPASGSSAGLLEAVFSELMHAEPVAARKGLVDSPVRAAIIFAGDVPREAGVVFPGDVADGALRTALRRSFLDFAKRSKDATRSELLYVIVQHAGIPDRSSSARQLQQLFNDEASMAEVPNGAFFAKVLYVRDASEASKVLLQSLLLINKSSVLAL